MRDDVFRAHVEALGMKVRHRHVVQGVVPLAEKPDEEWRKDIIDIRRLVSEYPKHHGAGVFTLDFSCIPHPDLRALVKRYFRARLGFWEAASPHGILNSMKPFFVALGKTYPEMRSFAALTREMIEPLLTLPAWTDQLGRRWAISTHKRGLMLGALHTMFTYMQQHEWEGAPVRLLIYDEDRPKPIKRRPRPLPQAVFEQLEAHMDLLPPYARNLIAILSVAGLRAEDALHLSEDCLDYDAAGDPRLLWFNHKMKRDGRPLPITTEVAEAIQRQRSLVRDIPDIFGKHYLFRTKRGLYKFARFCAHLNQAAQKGPILGEGGQIYHFKPHQFRHMVGTGMINAWATNMGLGRMGDISDIPFATLVSTSENFLRPETLKAANTCISNAIAALSVFRHYDIANVLHSSSDGQKFETALPTFNARYSPKYFGLNKGVVAYTLVANHVPVNAEMIGAHDHESQFVFDLLFNNTTDIHPQVHSTDTHGTNQVNFALLHLFGYQFAPRYKAIQEKLRTSLYGFEHPSQYGDVLLKPVRKLNIDLIVEE